MQPTFPFHIEITPLSTINKHLSILAGLLSYLDLELFVMWKGYSKYACHLS